MNIRSRAELKTFAAQRLTQAPSEKRIVMIYTAIAAGVSLLNLILSYVLGLAIDQTGGLSQMTNRAMLSTLREVLPLVASMVLTCLEVGYLSTMLRIARGQYASPNGLRLGFDRFWVLLRSTVLQGLVYSGIGILCLYASVYLFLLTPLSNAAMDILMPLVSDTTILSANAGLVLDDATYFHLLDSMTPMVLLFAAVFSLAALPVMYGYRMVNFILIDKPGYGARKALRESRRIMKHNRVSLFKLDLSLWWYYLSLLLITFVGYGDQLLYLAGIELPISADVGYFLFYILYVAQQFVLFYFLRNRVEVTYALAYDAIRPEEPQDGGVVLGNIFQM